MYCIQCGTRLEATGNFCSECGHPTSRESVPETPESAPTTLSPVDPNIEYFKPIGTKWLKFWNYFSLPVGGILGLSISLSMPVLWIFGVPISILQFVVAYGLHHRKIWAWQWNWLIIGLNWFGGTIPNSFDSYSFAASGASFVILGVIWMWPNYVYWKKRLMLFS